MEFVNVNALLLNGVTRSEYSDDDDTSSTNSDSSHQSTGSSSSSCIKRSDENDSEDNTYDGKFQQDAKDDSSNAVLHFQNTSFFLNSNGNVSEKVGGNNNKTDAVAVNKRQVSDCKLSKKQKERDRYTHHDPPRLKTHFPYNTDTTPLSAYFVSLFYPEVYMKIFYAVRITFMVALPLALCARMPKLMTIFPMHVVMPLMGIVDSKYRVGEQISTSIMSIQCGVFFMMWGTILNALNVIEHHSAWWCAAIFTVFVVSLFGDVRCKRYSCLFAALIFGFQHAPGGTRLVNPALIARDVCIATGFALLQVFVPPSTNAKECDDVLKGLWGHILRICKSSVTACWSEDPIECTLALSNMSTEAIQQSLAVLAMKMNFIMYEFWETTLRLELRRERIEILQAFRPRIHALTDTARAMVMKRPFVMKQYPEDDEMDEYGEVKPKPRKQRKSKKSRRHRSKESKYKPLEGEYTHVPFGSGLSGQSSVAERPLGGPKEKQNCPYGEEIDSADVVSGKETKSESQGDEEPVYFQTVRRNVSRIFGIKESESHDSRKSDPLGKKVGTCKHVTVPEPDKKSKKTNSSKGHHDRQLSQRTHNMNLWKLAKSIIEPALKDFMDAFERTLNGLGKHLNPKAVVENVPFDDLQEATDQLRVSLNKVHFEVLIKSESAADPFLYNNTIFLHLSLIALAGRILDYGLLMREFDRSRYKSQWVRIWEFFFYDYWRKFWEDLPNRLTLATKRDVRIVKDAIKMACAYGTGIMFTMYMDPENIYYFGMCILMGVGWPTAGDTMIASVYRITGMVCACSIAYVAIWHTNNLSGELSIALAGVFIALLFRDVLPYAQTAQYCSMLVITGLNSASTKLVLLSRIVSNCFTVMTYYAICVFLFPIDVLKVTYYEQMESILFVTDQFTQLVRIMKVPVNEATFEWRDAIATEMQNLDQRRKKGWRTIINFGTWMHKASIEPTSHGRPYPLPEMKSVYSSLRRLASANDILYSALFKLYCTPRTTTVDTNLALCLELISPVMCKIDLKIRVVMQDFIDAMARPLDWTSEKATRHFSDFLLLSKDLHDVFYSQNKRSTQAFRQQFRDAVLSRTFARAAQNNLININRSFVNFDNNNNNNLSFVLANSAAPGSSFAHQNGSFQINRASTGVTFATEVDAGVSEPGARTNATSQQPMKNASFFVPGVNDEDGAPLQVETTLQGQALQDALAPLEREAEDEAYAQFVGNTQRPQQHMQKSFRYQTSAATPYESKPSDLDAASTAQKSKMTLMDSSSSGSSADSSKSLMQVDAAVDLQNLFEVGKDVEMLMSIIVASEMFFTEAERLLRTMYNINLYGRSRDGPPKWESPLDV